MRTIAEAAATPEGQARLAAAANYLQTGQGVTLPNPASEALSSPDYAFLGQAEAIARAYWDALPVTDPGRRSKLGHVDVVHTLLSGAALGLNERDCCLAAGLDYATLQRWQASAALDNTSVYASLVDLMKSTRTQGKAALLGRIARASDKPQHWTAGAWILERTDPEQFGQRRDSDLTAPRIVVQIGVRDSDITVGVSDPTLQVVAAQGFGNTDTVNTTSIIGPVAMLPHAQDVSIPGVVEAVVEAEAAPDLKSAAAESTGGPGRRVRVQGGPHASAHGKSSRPRAKSRKAASA